MERKTEMKKQPWPASEITALRARLDLTQGELAHALGVSPCTVSRWEHGHMRPGPMARRLLEQLAKEAKGE